MPDSVFFALTLASALAAALMAGIFYAFSTMVMIGLRRMQPAQGIAAMQSINAAVYNPWFLGVFTGAAVLSLASVIVSFTRWGDDEAVYLLVGGVIYLIGSFGLTAGYHVPRNNVLATVDPDGADAPEWWDRYYSEWTTWNHVRAAACLVATACFIVALAVG